MIEAEWGPLFKGVGGKKRIHEYSIDPISNIAAILKGTFSEIFLKNKKRSSTNGKHASETCQMGCFTHELGKFAAEYNGSYLLMQKLGVTHGYYSPLQQHKRP
jgi:hypothetical protein